LQRVSAVATVATNLLGSALNSRISISAYVKAGRLMCRGL
jgi:hypothetical protein